MKQLTMTKVLTPLAALAFAFGVQAAVPSFDGFETETSTVVTNRTGWSFKYGTDGADDASAITAYNNNAPSAFPDGTTAGSNYLKLSTEDGMLFRNMDGANGESVQLNAGLYVDTDVQFTITDPSDRPEVTGEDKFIVWLEDQGASGTNLCAWAGYYNASGVLSSNVYTLADSESSPIAIAPNSWHRLTVKAIANVNAGGSSTIPGFQVYVDGHLFATTENFAHDDYVSNLGSEAQTQLQDMTFLPSMTAMESLSKVGFSGEGALDNVVVTKEVPGFADPTTLTFHFDEGVIESIDTSLGVTLTNDLATLRVAPDTTFTMTINWKDGYSTSTHSLTTESTATDCATVSDLAITTVAFGAATINLTTMAKDTVNVKFVWSALNTAMGADVADNTGISFTVGDVTYNADLDGDDGNNEYKIIENLKVNTNITITVTFASGTLWTATYSTSSANVGINNNVVTINSRGDGMATVNISAMPAQATINGQPYGSLADALSAAATAGTATIALAADATVGDAAIASGKDITIDLAGHNITGNSGAAAVFSVADGGTLTITNSTVGIGIVSKGSATACISNAGTLNLQAGKFDIANGAISGGTINVTGGAYNAATFTGATLPSDKKISENTGALDAYAYELVDKVYINSITLDQATLELTVGGSTATLTATYAASDDDSVAWTSSDDTVATVANGVVTPVAVGTATITVAAVNGTGTASCTVTVASGAPVVPELVPTNSTETVTTYTQADAEYITNAINSAKSTYIKAPEGITGEAATAYSEKFEAKMVEDSGSYKVVVELTSAAQTELATDANAKVATVADSLSDIAADATGEKTEVSITGAKPGFYYSISYGTSLGAMNTEGDRVLAPASGSITLETPAKASGATSGFYRVNVNITDK